MNNFSKVLDLVFIYSVQDPKPMMSICVELNINLLFLLKYKKINSMKDIKEPINKDNKFLLLEIKKVESIIKLQFLVKCILKHMQSCINLWEEHGLEKNDCVYFIFVQSIKKFI